MSNIQNQLAFAVTKEEFKDFFQTFGRLVPVTEWKKPISEALDTFYKALEDEIDSIQTKLQDPEFLTTHVTTSYETDDSTGYNTITESTSDSLYQELKLEINTYSRYMTMIESN